MRNNQALPGPDYYVEADVLVRTANASASFSVNGRQQSGSLTFYSLQFSNGFYTLRMYVNGTFTNLGTYSASAGIMPLGMDGDQISGSVNGVLRIGPVTEDTIQGAGTIGTRMFGNNSTGTQGLDIEAMRAGAL